jgi:hypothetical protein
MKNIMRRGALYIAGILITLHLFILGLDLTVNTLFFDELFGTIIVLIMGRIIWVLKKTEVE